MSEDLDLRTGTSGYPSGSDGYPADREDPTETEGYWVKLGFESEDAFWESLGARPAGGVQTDVPKAALPDRGRTPTPFVRQVNIKLATETFEGLQRLADSYGVAPSTMARMLVSRGVRIASGG